MAAERVKEIARGLGFGLVGIAGPDVSRDFHRYQDWVARGFHGEMGYLADRRGEMRADARLLFPACRSVISLGLLYQTPYPSTPDYSEPERGWISRYAWGDDYHPILKQRLAALASDLQNEAGDFQWKGCVDTSPLAERTFARMAGLGWIGKNTCLINEQQGSWFFLAELLTDLELAADGPAPERCGSCTRCIDVCPTEAIVPAGNWWTIDARRCISYLTIEHRGPIDEPLREGLGRHVFGCDLCQDVCPWNRRSPVTDDPAFAPRQGEPGIDLVRLSEMTEAEFRGMFRRSPLARPKYEGFLRNVALAMGNIGGPIFEEPLRRLALHPTEVVADAARWALGRGGRIET